MQAEIKNGMLRLPLSPYRDEGRTIKLTSSVEGRKYWLTDGNLLVENSGHNRAQVAMLFPEVKIGTPPVVRHGLKLVARPKYPYEQKTTPYAHQTRALAAARTKQHFALFLEQGTGKTKVALDRAGELYAADEIDAVLIVTKKGVHSQWVNEQIPTHLGNVEYVAEVWKGRGWSPALLEKGKLKIASINIDALSASKMGICETSKFLSAHLGRVLFIVDESQVIKNYRARRTKACVDLAPFASHRMILTGTPIAKDLCDEWSQLRFLNPSILDIKYITMFRAQYCIMGGFENRAVIGVKNLAEFKRRVDPHSFRVTKEAELDLPPKMYAPVVFEMSDEQRRHYRSMKELFMTELDNGEIVSVKIAATCLMRLQQITCGVLPPVAEGDPYTHLSTNPRMDALLELLEQRSGKAIIWARFNEDIKLIKKALGARAVTYFGETSTEERGRAVANFLDPDSEVDYFVSNPAAGGTGLNLQGECRTVVYYSNSFSSLDRWQSEDRTHRIGTTQTVTYFDLICAGSPDRKILANLRAKKSVSDMALGDVKELFHELD